MKIPWGFFLFIFLFWEISILTELFPIFSCKKTLLNITSDKKGSSKFPHTVIYSFMITIKVGSFHCLLNLQFAEIQTGQIFDRILGGDKLIGEYFENVIMFYWPTSC